MLGLLWTTFTRYVRLLGAMYMRLTGTAVDCYKYLEPLYNDYRKIKTQNRNGGERSSRFRSHARRRSEPRSATFLLLVCVRTCRKQKVFAQTRRFWASSRV